MYGKFLMAAIAVMSISTFAPPAQAQMKLRVSEEAVESNTETVSAPATLPGSVSFKPCGRCSFLTLSVDETARFFVGKEQVTLADFHRYANRASSRLDVFYDRKTQRVTRLILRTHVDSAEAEES